MKCVYYGRKVMKGAGIGMQMELCSKSGVVSVAEGRRLAVGSKVVKLALELGWDLMQVNVLLELLVEVQTLPCFYSG